MMSVSLNTKNWIACEHCDWLHQEVKLPVGSQALCCRCGSELYRADKSLQALLALCLTSLILLLLANLFPIVTLEVQGQRHASSLLGAVWQLYQQGMGLVAMLVMATTLIFPALELCILSYVCLGVVWQQHWPAARVLMRILSHIRPWGMIEVFMLGVLVSLVKLTHIASIVPGVALWAFGCLTLCMALILSFDLRQLWRNLYQIGR